jgi:hypothetical protein
MTLFGHFRPHPRPPPLADPPLSLRLEVTPGNVKSTAQLLDVAKALSAVGEGVRVCSLELLLSVDGKKGYSLAQGQ